LLDDRSWKNLTFLDLVVRDGLEAWINDEMKPVSEIDNLPLDFMLSSICERVGWDMEYCVNMLVILGVVGITKFKHLRVLKKKTLYHLGLPVLLVQELRAEIKTVMNSIQAKPSSSGSAPAFKLPIVGQPSTYTDSVTGQMGKMAILEGDRVVREIGGRTYEYDRKCPHKSADLTYVCPISLRMFSANRSVGASGGRHIDLPKAQVEVRS